MKKTSKADINRIVRLYYKGLNWSRLSRESNKSITTIKKYLIELGIIAKDEKFNRWNCIKNFEDIKKKDAL